jgi:hypothetical protein
MLDQRAAPPMEGAVLGREEATGGREDLHEPTLSTTPEAATSWVSKIVRAIRLETGRFVLWIMERGWPTRTCG